MCVASSEAQRLGDAADGRGPLFPCVGTYRFGRWAEPVVVLGLGRHAELRIIGTDGYVRAEPWDRVQLVLEGAA